MITFIIPIYNEERILKKNILNLKRNLDSFKDYRIIIAGINSTDNSNIIAKKLADNKKIFFPNIKSKFKGGKIKEAALMFDSDYYIFSDADLPISFDGINSILNYLVSDKAVVVTASRYLKGAASKRPLRRIIASKTYNFLLKILFLIPITDACAGVKAWNKKSNKLWKKVVDEKWFFDTEFLYYNHKAKYKIKEIPVVYNDLRDDSKLKLFEDGKELGFSLIKFWLKKI